MKTALAIFLLAVSAFAVGPDFDKKVEHGYADSNGVKIH